jgi:hypothetical protein
MTAAVALLLCGPALVQAQVGYDFLVTSHYQFSPYPGGINFGIEGGPDTGYAVIHNSGTSTFVGMIRADGTATSGPGNDVHVTTGAAYTLAPGATVVLGLGPESSNVGGFNSAGPGLPQNGILVSLVGTVTEGGSEAVSLSVFDKDIHSGVPRTNPFGVTLDNYVLQGGDPFGRDTGDGYEVTQADGHFRFFEQAIPEPSSYLLIGMGLAGIAAFSWRSRKTK